VTKSRSLVFEWERWVIELVERFDRCLALQHECAPIDPDALFWLEDAPEVSIPTFAARA
jgi:hypothetical protein